MTLGRELAKARVKKELTQQELSEELLVSRESVAKYEKDKRTVPNDIKKRSMETLDDPWLAMQIAREDANGAWVPVLDGEAVDLHRTTVQHKTIEEAKEAIEAIQKISSLKKPGFLKDEEIQEIEKSLLEAIDAIIALNHYVAVYCDEYNFSWSTMWKKQYMKLKSNGYVR
ncbi:helix-turn-helix domain-containing protein [Bacillus sp. RG28]|uniref:Helix-turn-helix domain-containing protein n=1 Tax=Gottfriedia endophytica TaxID=2820819 RepID=A0A940SJK5_9BACI|nr:helix-turn-helix transcriptional regulator [Gottfriedia endophytica]MBP0725566.1 helix-turn-helix domain-containing protein [Gottfriedia endophytica]